MNDAWKVYRNGRFTGIVETNFAWASAYWSRRKGCKLVPWNDKHLRFPFER